MDNVKIENIASSLKNEVILLNLKWAIYKSLFESESRKNILTEISPILFMMHQRMFLDDIAITLSRLTDEDKKGKLLNNTLDQLILQKGCDPKPLIEVKEKLAPIRKLRNKFIGHRDLEETLGHFLSNTTDRKTAINLNFPLTVAATDQIINEINKIMNNATGQNLEYEHFHSPCGPDAGVTNLIDTIKIGLFYNQMEKTNKIDPLDYYDEWEKFDHKNA